MRLRRAVSVLVMVAGIFGIASPVRAQGLNEVLASLLSNVCARLGGAGNTSAELVSICKVGGGGGAASAGATATAETRGTDVSQAFRRLRQRQGVASADPGASGFSVFASADYQK